MIEEGWERFFDDKEQHYYLYNAATQESKWEEGGVNPQESEEAWKGGVRWGGAGEGRRKKAAEKILNLVNFWRRLFRNLSCVSLR